MAKGKKRYHCRACGKFFISVEDRIEKPERKPRPTTSAYRRGPQPKELPSAGHLVLKLRSIAVKFGRSPTTAEIARLSKEGRSYPLDDYYKVFGSFLEALKKARIKPRYRQEFDEHDRSRLLHELQSLSRRLKRPLLGRDIPPARKKGLVSPVNHFHIAFGTIPNAIALAGVAPKKTYTRDEMITVLRELDMKLDRPVEKKDIEANNRAGKGPSVNVIAREFGNLGKARRAAGIQRSYEKAARRTRHWQKYTKQELIAQLQALGKELGRKPTDREINRECKNGKCASAATFASMFGSLVEAYRAAGFDDIGKRLPVLSDEEILAGLLKLRDALGRFPAHREIAAASKAGHCASNNTIIRRLGPIAELKAKYG